MITCVDVGRKFGRLIAVESLSLSVREGEVLGVVGSNGAGKSTLFNLIAGTLRPTSGEIWFRGERIDGIGPVRAARSGIARTFQTAEIIPGTSVYEHVSLGAWYGRHGLADIRPGRSAAVAESVEKALATVDLSASAGMDRADLDHFGQRRMMLAAALASSPEILLLDELASGLDPNEVSELATLVQRIEDSGQTMIIIEHLISFLIGTVSRMLVMHSGRELFAGTPDEVLNNEAVEETWLGKRGSGGNV